MPGTDTDKKIFRVALPVFLFLFLSFLPSAGDAAAFGQGPALDQNPAGGQKGHSAQPLVLGELIKEAMAKNPRLAAYGFLVSAQQRRVPQVKSLPDPRISVGYQNEGWDRYSYGDTIMSQWMFYASQTFPYPGKLGLKGEIAGRQAKYAGRSYEDLRLRIARQVKDLYFDLLLYYKDLDIIRQRAGLYAQMEKAALARYSAGLAPQEEVVLAQTEKYTLLEKKEKIEQKIAATDADLDSVLGRAAGSPLGRPVEAGYALNVSSAAPLVAVAIGNSPRIKAQQELVEGARAGVALARKQYYPDFTVTGGVNKKGGPYKDDWSLVTAMNVPLYYRTKQREGVLEAKALLRKAKADFEADRLSIAADVEDFFSVAQSAGNLMDLYRKGLIPKTYQDFEAALSGYVAGNVPALTAIDRLKSLLGYEFDYWQQYAARQKAIAGIEALAGKTAYITEGPVMKGGQHGRN